MEFDDSVAAWCIATLGSAPARELFRRSHLSHVVGLELDDGRQVVVKVRPGSPRLDAATAVQRHVHRQRFPCPGVLAGPLPLGDRVATAEEYIAPHGFPPDPPPPEPVARLLAELVAAAPSPETATALAPAPPWVGWDHPSDQLWPWPDDFDVDMNDHAGPEWIDDTAQRIRDRMRRDTSAPVIGHIDWEAHNLDWDGSAPVVVHDWDSLAIRTEAAVAGAAAAVYPANGVTASAATIAQTAAFLVAYREVRSAQWTTASDEIAWCAGLWALTYNAKKETLGGSIGHLEHLGSELSTRRSYAGL